MQCVHQASSHGDRFRQFKINQETYCTSVRQLFQVIHGRLFTIIPIIKIHHDRIIVNVFCPDTQLYRVLSHPCFQEIVFPLCCSVGPYCHEMFVQRCSRDPQTSYATVVLYALCGLSEMTNVYM